MAMSDLNSALNPEDPTTTSYDADQLAEEIETGEEVAPKVDADADYERSKQFDVADIDRPGNQASASTTSATSGETGNPENFLDMAKQVKPDSEA
jgi:hypothetical protein